MEKIKLAIIGANGKQAKEYYSLLENHVEITTLVDNQSGWRGRRVTSGGGVIIDLGYHALDVIIQFFGRPSSVRSAISFSHLETKNERVEDIATILLKYKKDDLHGVINLSRYYFKNEETLNIVGSNGSMIITPKTFKLFNKDKILEKEYHYDNYKTYSVATLLNSFFYSSDLTKQKKHLSRQLEVMDIIDSSYKKIVLS